MLSRNNYDAQHQGARLSFRRVWDVLDTRGGAGLALAALYLVGVALTLRFVTGSAYGPIHFNDEIRYWNTLQALYRGTFTVTSFHHSPPLYPTTLLPLTLLPGSQLYTGVKALNALVFTSAVFPFYLLLRAFAGRRLSLLVSAVFLLLPSQLVVPRLVMSENLFYPLFLWAVLLAFTHRWKLGQSLALGVLMGLMVLTRYLGLPVVFALLAAWWLKPLGEERLPMLLSRRKLLHLALVVAPFVAILGAWVLLGMREGVPVKEMLGFGVASNPDPAQLGRRRLVMWAAFYLSYTTLMLAPYLGVLAAALVQMRRKDWNNSFTRWLASVALVTASFLVTATRHSWRARYNFPEPDTIQGRYIFYLAPLFLITAIAALKMVKFERLSRSAYALLVVVAGEAAAGAYLIIFHGAVFLGRPVRMSLNSPDGYLFQSLGAGYVLTALLLLAFGAYLAPRRKRLIMLGLPLALAAIWLAGDLRLYQSILKPLQEPNYPVSRLIALMDATYGDSQQLRAEPVHLLVPYRMNEEYCRIWLATFRFNGFRDVKCTRGKPEDSYDRQILFVRARGDEFSISMISRQEYIPRRSNQYTFNGKYYLLDYADH